MFVVCQMVVVCVSNVCLCAKWWLLSDNYDPFHIDNSFYKSSCSYTVHIVFDLLIPEMPFVYVILYRNNSI